MTSPTDDDLPPLIETPPGRYRHYKGGEYEVLGTVRHSETLEPMTLYRALYGAHGPVGAPRRHVRRDGGDRRPATAALRTDRIGPEGQRNADFLQPQRTAVTRLRASTTRLSRPPLNSIVTAWLGFSVRTL